MHGDHAGFLPCQTDKIIFLQINRLEQQTDIGQPPVHPVRHMIRRRRIQVKCDKRIFLMKGADQLRKPLHGS